MTSRPIGIHGVIMRLVAFMFSQKWPEELEKPNLQWVVWFMEEVKAYINQWNPELESSMEGLEGRMKRLTCPRLGLGKHISNHNYKVHCQGGIQCVRTHCVGTAPESVFYEITDALTPIFSKWVIIAPGLRSYQIFHKKNHKIA